MFGYSPATTSLAEKRKAKRDYMLDRIKEAAEQISTDRLDKLQIMTVNANMRQAALSIVLKLTMLMDEGSHRSLLPNELLDNLMFGVFNDDGDGELDPTVYAVLSAHIADAFSSLGVDKTIVKEIFHDDYKIVDSAIKAAYKVVLDNLPADGEALDDFAKIFIYGFYANDDNQAAYDNTTVINRMFSKQSKGRMIKYDALKAICSGKPMANNKRTSGIIRLSDKQKAALRQIQTKSKTVPAMQQCLPLLVKSYSLNGQ